MFALSVALVLLAAPAVDSPEYKEQLSEGLRRHDGGDYAGAMTVYRSMLATWPHEPLIVYELSLSMNAAGTSPDELITFVESELKWLTESVQVLSLGGKYRLQVGPFASAGEARTMAERIAGVLKLKPFVVQH